MRQELERLLDTHRAQRPEMQPQDYYKPDAVRKGVSELVLIKDL